jgi:hypothetical protein
MEESIMESAWNKASRNLKKKYSIGGFKNLDLIELMAIATTNPEIFKPDQLKMVLDIKAQLTDWMYDHVKKGDA